MEPKILAGRHPYDLSQQYVDIAASNKRLTNADLFNESEGFLIAIQDQIILTRNYWKYILREPHTITDKQNQYKELA
jgi:hypothetical protein